ncbi:hypothetical protein GCM10022222_01320 [Amycolatopsis ultiminotia]|uniref:Multifunctional fusion protein n=1 Tax=Amycolatopsis ultiminotia TaxID=543629 RepID=A0ABP6UZ34_9PSEU
MTSFDSVPEVLDDLRSGKPVVVVDDQDRENEGDLICAAQFATSEVISFLVRHSSGYLCVAMPGEAADRLDLPPMVTSNEDPRGTAYTVTADARTGVGTGISARDRARTARVLADPGSQATDLTRPGHVVPLRARRGGVLERRGHTESAVDLMTLAGMRPAGVLAEVVSELDPTGMARLPELQKFAREHDLRIISVDDIVRYRRERVVQRVTRSRLPVCDAPFDVLGYRDVTGVEQIALVLGELEGAEDVLVRVHSECFTGDVLGSMRCDCGPQLQDALAAIVAAGRGVVVYVRGHEGRGIGLLRKLETYRLQDRGCDTVDANLALGLPVDARDYAAPAAILHDLGIRSIRLLSGNPAKLRALREHGVAVERMTPPPARVTKYNQAYLETKRARLGHRFPGVQDPPEAVIGIVEHGDARGRVLGFPTANLSLEIDECELADGVYGGLAWVHGDEPGDATAYVAAISVGTNPTFAGVEQRFEVHLLDFDRDIYGRELMVVPRAFLRPMLAFDSAGALVNQIRGDLDEIRALARDWQPRTGATSEAAAQSARSSSRR